MPSKKMLFITTKNIDYLRNVQEIKAFNEEGYQVDVIGSSSKNYILRIMKVYWNLLVRSIKKYDVVFIGFAPQLIMPFFYWKLKKHRVWIDFFISMYDTFVCDRKKIKEGSLAARILHKMDWFTLQKAERVIADTKAHKLYFVEEFGVSGQKIEVKYLEADVSIYKKTIVEKPAELLDKFIVLYFGSVLPLQGIEVILEAVRLLKNEKNIHFILIGPMEKKLKKVEQDNVTYYNWLSQEELAKKIAMADLCLAGHFSGTIMKAKRTIPGKAYIYQAMDKKIIFGDSPANHELFGDQELFVEMGNANALSDCIRKCYLEWRK